MKGKVVIFSASTGQGHNQVADTLKDELTEKGYFVKVIEPFKETSPFLDEFVTDGYKILATKIPIMFGTLYKVSNKKIVNKSLSTYTIHRIRNKIDELLKDLNAEMVICTHPLFVKAISHMKLKGMFRGKVVSVITDYVPHEFYVGQQVDAYIVGSNYTKWALINKGIDADRIYVHGIPIKRVFSFSTSQLERSNNFTVLLMGGSMGLSGMKKAYKNLLNIERPMKIYVVCGNNKALRNSLQYYDSNIHQVELLGYTDRVPELMELSDVIISKPGGLTVTESLAKEIPMIIPYCIPGQEEENTQVLVDEGAAIRVKGAKHLEQTVSELMSNPIQLDLLKRNIRRMNREFSLDDTIQLCIDVMRDYNEVVERINA